MIDDIIVMDENQKLLDLNMPKVGNLDDHKSHIESHMELLSDPNNKANPEIVEAVIKHCQEHIDKLVEIVNNNINAFGVQRIIEDES